TAPGLGLGNRALARLFEERIGRPNDALEREAERVGEAVARGGVVAGDGVGGISSAGGVQRGGGGGGEGGGEKVRPAPPAGSGTPETAADGAPVEAESQDASGPDAAPVDRGDAITGPTLLVDEVGDADRGQLGKTEFLAALRLEVIAAADAVLAGTGRDSREC